jgi:hypothetical protein
MSFDIIERVGRGNNFVFITSNFHMEANASSDIDIYCVIQEGCSSVNLAYDANGVWTEVFIDTMADLSQKIANFDEIAMNFILELSFVAGDRAIYDALHATISQAVTGYRLPQHRKNLLKYRIKTLLSKYLSTDLYTEIDQAHFLLNSMTYPLIQLILEHHQIFPSSPKRWLMQLKTNISDDECALISRFLSHKCSKTEVELLCDRYTGKLDPIFQEKPSAANRTTALS